MDLYIFNCITIIYSCIFILQTSQFPLKDNRLTSSPSKAYAVDSYEQVKTFYYPTIREYEVMKLSASTYYSSDDDNDDDNQRNDGKDDYTDLSHSSEIFESRKIVKKISDKKDYNLRDISNNSKIEPNKTKILYEPSLSSFETTSANVQFKNNDSSDVTTDQFSKLLFSSPSATVTSSGASGPFKAIICHDCENSGGVNTGHYSVSFSAIKSWNVGNNEKLNFSVSTLSSIPEKTPSIEINTKLPEINAIDQIQGNVKSAMNYEDGMQSTSPDLLNNKNEWNYSLFTLKNDNVNSNGSLATSITSNIVPKKPIFNDLLKVPYDVLNAPLHESSIKSSTESIEQTQININHQQKINDTITNYQHFQQFLQKNSPTSSMPLKFAPSTSMPEQNYEVDETLSLMTNGRAHGIQSSTPKINVPSDVDKKFNPTFNTQENVDGQDAKFGVVFEGRDFRKYKVEEKTADGFIVGEYGYLSNTDGSPLFGVRYTADSNINPQLIYDALLKFIKL